MKVTLVSFTKPPVETVLWAESAMHAETIPEKIVKIKGKKERTEAERKIKNMLKSNFGTPLEYISTIWLLEDVSRALQTQLIRTRLASFSIQSMRCVPKDEFAKKHMYYIPEGIKKKGILKDFFVGGMLQIQDVYRLLRQYGASIEDARGILPLNIYSTITMCINFRSLSHLISDRLCLKAQGEIRKMAQEMRNEIKKKMDPILARSLLPPCLMTANCIMEVENKEYLNSINMKEKVCPLYENFLKRERNIALIKFLQIQKERENAINPK